MVLLVPLVIRHCITDLRGSGRWTPADYTRQADLWIVSSSWTEKPTPQRTLAHLSASYLTIDGALAGGVGTLNRMIGTLIQPLAVPPLWTSADGRQTLCPINLNARHAASELADLVTRKMAAFDGVLIDYFCGLGWAYPGAFSEDFWALWDRSLRAWVEQMRALRPDWIIVGQVHQNTEPTGALNGRYIEQDLTSFGCTFESNAKDVSQFTAMAKLTGREVVFVAELRDPLRYPAYYVDQVKAFCESTGAYLSAGRDATAGMAL